MESPIDISRIREGFRVMAGPSEVGYVVEIIDAARNGEPHLCVRQPMGGDLWIPQSDIEQIDDGHNLIYVSAESAQEIPERGWNTPPGTPG